MMVEGPDSLFHFVSKYMRSRKSVKRSESCICTCIWVSDLVIIDQLFNHLRFTHLQPRQVRYVVDCLSYTRPFERRRGCLTRREIQAIHNSVIHGSSYHKQLFLSNEHPFRSSAFIHIYFLSYATGDREVPRLQSELWVSEKADYSAARLLNSPSEPFQPSGGDEFLTLNRGFESETCVLSLGAPHRNLDAANNKAMFASASDFRGRNRGPLRLSHIRMESPKLVSGSTNRPFSTPLPFLPSSPS